MPYDPDYAIPESPPLQAVHVPAKPEPPPLPFIPKPPLSPIRLSSQSRRGHKRQRRRMAKPVLGDGVLLSFMNPNYPEVHRRATEVALNSASQSEVSDTDMEDKPKRKPKRGSRSRHETPEAIARAATELLQAQVVGDRSVDTAVRLADPPLRRGQLSPQASLDVANLQISALEPDGSEAPRPGTSGSLMLMDGPSPNRYPAEPESLATSPNLREHTIPDSEGPLSEKLPALCSPHPSSTDGGPGSPAQARHLPAFAELNKLAEAASHDQESHRANGFPHRPSISSVNGQPLPVLTQVSPISANGETSPSDMWKAISASPNNMPPTPKYDRRFSHASDLGTPSYAPLRIGGPTPDSQEGAADPAQAHRGSIDMKTRVLPLPVASMGAGAAHHTTNTGSYGCDFPGCTAPPFQTQYLLNSHANVHSQNRPHYCPVRGCPRGEGGRGFKRKNEMIRHGLVHDSPGYVCPFCPEREHRYPRPDNLQRHVRVHHIDKDKDDAALRDVLSQRPEGPSRGRRRRVGA